MAIAKHSSSFKTVHSDVEIKVVGKKSKDKPYLRLAYVSPESGEELNHGYLASIDNVNVLRGLANQILRALDGE